MIGLLVAWKPLAVVALIVAIVGIVIVVTRAELVLLVMIAALPWENKLHYPSATLSIVKGIGALVLFAYLLRLIGDRRTRIQLPPLLGIVALFGLWVGLSMVVAPEPAQSVQEMVRWVLFFAFFFLIIQLIDGRAEIRRALRWFTASVSAAALYGLWQFVVMHSSYRVEGPLEDPNDFAYLLACTLPIAAYLMSADRRRRLLWGAAFVVIAAAMLATFSRGALVGLGAVLAVGRGHAPHPAVGARLGVGQRASGGGVCADRLATIDRHRVAPEDSHRAEQHRIARGVLDRRDPAHRAAPADRSGTRALPQGSSSAAAQQPNRAQETDHPQHLSGDPLRGRDSGAVAVCGLPRR